MSILEELVVKLLDDDHGINEGAYFELLAYLASLEETDLLEAVNNKTEACDGRFYYPLTNYFEDE